MFVYLKETELYRKIFINKNYKQGTVRLLFDKETPVHEVKDDLLAAAIVESFPNYLEFGKVKPSYLNKKVEPKPSDSIPAPEIIETPSEPEESISPVVQDDESVVEVDKQTEEKVEEKKETKKPGRKKKSSN